MEAFFSRVFVKGGRKMGWFILLHIILKLFSITFNIIPLEGIATKYLGCKACKFSGVISQKTWSRNEVSSNILSFKANTYILYHCIFFLFSLG